MLVTEFARRRLGVPVGQARVRIGPADSDHRMRRRLLLSGAPAFDLPSWCGTCPIVFERQEGANETLSPITQLLGELEGRLNTLDERIVDLFAGVLAEGEYLPLLLTVHPTLVAPLDDSDYFAHEQVATWGIDPFWGLPNSPRTYYYRTFTTPVTPDEHLYEFVVPMVPPSWNERDRVQHYIDLLTGGGTPTAVALSILDVRTPAMNLDVADIYTHWGLSHFLLDGHHKFEAAARTGRAVQLLSFVSIDDSVAEPAAMKRLPELLAQTQAARARREREVQATDG